MPTAQFQQTLAKSATLAGTSLHTGEKVTLTIHPAPAGFGRKFKRGDMPDQPILDAKVESVKTVERATTIAEGAVKVHTCEHVLSALAGLGVDNVLIEMDANEPPIGDGSAQPYVELIKKAGIVAQEAVRHVFEITTPLHIETNGGSLMTIVPDEKFRISCTNVGPDGLACTLVAESVWARLNGADAAAISSSTVRDKKFERVIFMASYSCMRERSGSACR